jgi:hypothetical protein
MNDDDDFSSSEKKISLQNWILILQQALSYRNLSLDGSKRRWNDWTFVTGGGMWRDINLFTSMLDWVLINVLVCFYPSCRLYQVRCSLKVSPGKLPIQIETCIPDQNANSQTTGPCIINGAGVSKVFQILYRNEEVSLRDVIMFRAHLLGKFMAAKVIKLREIVRSLVGEVSIS